MSSTSALNRSFAEAAVEDGVQSAAQFYLNLRAPENAEQPKKTRQEKAICR
jgi:hypothetical protein